MRQPKLADSSGAELDGSGLLARSLVFRRVLRREVLGEDERMVGVLLPPSVAAVVANAALTIDCRVTVNLNYTMTPELIDDCIRQCGIRHVLSSRKIMERLGLRLGAEVVYLEDFRDRVRPSDKLAAAAMAWLMPLPQLERHLGLTDLGEDDLLTVIFTSGSTGRPKGVMLTHRNIGSNVGAVARLVRLADTDVMVGVLPLFHAFGYTATMWTVLMLAPKGVYHYSPLEAREVGKLCRQHKGTIMISAPTFLRSYLRRCEPEDFAKLDVVVTGAERLAPEVAAAFEQRFGVRPVEGYGTTELSPIVSSNIPPSRAIGAHWEKGSDLISAQHPSGRSGKSDRPPFSVKDGTVGRPLLDVAVKVVDLDTGADLGPNRSGMLLVSGPNVMKGYLGRPDLTAEVIHDGWYTTGDVATIDDEGFITITGRISRFSKLGGEMVPHLRVEEAIAKVLALGEDDLKMVVTAVPDPKKGERLVVLYTELGRDPEAVCRALAAGGLPPLWIPSPESFRRVAAIPTLGTGKLDLKRVKDLAAAEFAVGPASA
jgi:acyl-[acyl-carrier-protein]-phospholipid O-acyltransferase/long-chain-fatty-acid--[acyl-carrier-protein] ligase